MQEKNPFLSKTLFLKGLKCKKLLYLSKYYPNLKHEVSSRTEELFETGNEVNALAKKLFQKGREIPSNETREKQIELTLSFLKEGVENIYEASFFLDSIFVRTDILHKGKKGWNIYEVKSTTGLKDEHIYDIALQYYVVKGCGFDIESANLVHINPDYIRWGELEIEKLLTIKDLTEKIIDSQKKIKEKIEIFKEVLKGEMPEVDIGGHCFENYTCEFRNYCWKNIPENSILRIEAHWMDRFELYKKGILVLEDLNQEEFEGNSKMFIDAYIGKKVIFNKKNIKEFLESLWYPMAFLDFETFSYAIPLYDGTKPYQQIPFQYSLYIIYSRDSEPEHFNYIAPPRTDPRKELTEKLLREIPLEACVIVYNEKFEKRIINELSEFLPEHREKLLLINNNVRDLMLPFKRKDYYHWEMLGSHSLKKVLPAVIPEMSYEEMDIKNGEMAMSAYFKMCKSNSPEEIAKIRDSLIHYCSLDTLAMVKILKKLQELTEN